MVFEFPWTKPPGLFLIEEVSIVAEAVLISA